jgi:hypothetical protein
MLYIGNIRSPGAVGVRTGEERRTNVMSILWRLLYSNAKSRIHEIVTIYTL